ncbi:unnamed protein product, partial [Discosporangium mesarthrocarpum]
MDGLGIDEGGGRNNSAHDEGTGTGFDPNSLRAMPLHIRLQHASLSSAERSCMLRQYALSVPGRGQGQGQGQGGKGRRWKQTSEVTAHGVVNPRGGGRSSGGGGGDPLEPSSLVPAGGGEVTSGAAGMGREARGPPLTGQACWGAPELSPTPRRGRPASQGEEAILSEGWGGDLERLSMSQVDKDVLQQLPLDVREEVLRSI